jgi:tetratricopeptide (TPR) repeat protein
VRNKFLSGGILFLSSLMSAAQVSHQNSNPSLLQDAAQAITVGELSRAEGDLQSVLRTAPDDYRALDLLGVVRVLQRRETGAEKLFRRAIQKKPDFAPAHAHLGLLYGQMGHPEDAVPQLREAVRLDPARSDASGALVRLFQDQARAASATGASEKALAFLMDARQYSPDDPDVNSELGTIALQLSLWQEAIEAFERTLKMREDDPLTLYNLGRAFTGLSQFAEARQPFARYVVVRPDDASGHCALGMTLAALEDVAEARKEFERSIALAPAQTESYFRLGLIDLDAKDLDEAATNLHQVLAREPKHAGALSALGRVAFEQKRYPEAIDLLQQAIASDESLREAHYYLGLTFARVGRKEEAEAQLQIATRLGHDEAERRRTLFRIQDGTVIDPLSSQPQK